MAADYPSSLPVKETPGTNLSTNPHSQLHNDMYDEIVALATELGTLPKGTAASVKARLDALPRGVMGVGVSTTASVTSGTTLLDVAGLTVTFTAVAGRRYRASGIVHVARSVGTDQFIVEVAASLGRSWHYDTATAGAATSSVPVFYTNSASISGSLTWKLRYGRVAGTGSLSVPTEAEFKSFFMVEDVGAL